MDNYTQKFNTNQQLYSLAEEIINRLDENGTKEHRKFVQETLDKYKAVLHPEGQTYSQDWSAYNEAQQKEKLLLMAILDELLVYFPDAERIGVGRKPVSLRDKIFYVIMQAYNIKSSRRCISDLEIARRLKHINKTPHFNTVLKCLKDPSLTPLLKHLVQISGLPLQAVETDFAVDSSGFTTSQFGRWFEYKWGSHEGKERLWKKIHLTCGVKTNIITALNITPGNYADSPQFGNLVQKTSQIYEVKEVSADKAYSSKANLQTVKDIGALPFIPFKTNTRDKGVGIWHKMYKFFINYPEEFGYHYHKRSNVETVFHMLKRKFGSHLRSKTETGQANEILAKCLCHNLCVLIQEAHEIGIKIDFNKSAEYPYAHNQV
jgi:transposase